MGIWASKSIWNVSEIPDLHGKVIIVTGGNTGAGYETVKALLKNNAKVYMASRSRTKAQAAIARLKEQTGKVANFLQLDLADLAIVKQAADEYLRREICIVRAEGSLACSEETRLDVLINSAGVMMSSPDHLTTQGYDLQFGTNVIGHFYFTKLLLPLLIATGKLDPSNKPRVVNTSSTAFRFHPAIDYNLMRDGSARREMTGQVLYGHSKFGNIVFAIELARRYGDHIVSTSINPGGFHSELRRDLPSYVQFMMRWIAPGPDSGAVTQLWAATSHETKDYNGKFLTAWALLGEVPKEARDPAVGEKMWAWLLEQVQGI